MVGALFKQIPALHLQEALEEFGNRKFKHSELAMQVLRYGPLLNVTDDVRAFAGFLVKQKAMPAAPPPATQFTLP